ncbi:RNA polymerase sigma factor [Gracilimonas mengyeensis]|uniref:RNA polymerase sigma factor, sigma-70 family n=1 Tax=Gracilimonas mengyeensis TaxID=1302730 RepID=A0A521C586_9BACT|nr:sigma-70 family RNA polymerase sigma factor [Gracilimonas mengyeensis]SMO53840.1 RNA polymerase sigma factor, sigma-70 family [Gracilimonas mengyeensis]
MLAKVTKPNQWSTRQSTSWEDLWVEVISGNRKALSDLYCYSYSHLYKYGYKIYPDNALVKDGIQELFLNIWDKRQNLSEAKSVKSYLFSSLRRILLRRLQKMRNRTKRNHDYNQDSFEQIYNIEELLIHFETERHKKEQLMVALRALTKRQKEAIYLKFYSGLSNNEISEVMNLNKQSVYNHISKAISRMQEFIKV